MSFSFLSFDPLQIAYVLGPLLITHGLYFGIFVVKIIAQLRVEKADKIRLRGHPSGPYYFFSSLIRSVMISSMCR